MPGRVRLTIDLLEHLARTPPQGDKEDALPVQLREFFVSGQLRIEHQFGGQLPAMLFPEADKLENLASLLALGDAGIGIAQNALRGVASQENQNPLLRATAAGYIVFSNGSSVELAGTL